ncbi:hypothetical protein [Haloarcula salinisoli]|uniref:Uncharacterized protein n=1 Tax=Haloarcula salinisoli TaxID=2487746 RepID=A0A8J7YHK6_9EURY|nr:hypothetical protein [Halomicroarcula salinisoli]MBX0306065.1 hypothetical protein [Halomicroarcula salinisoli]
MAENAFLTDRRRDYLAGEYDGSDSAERHLKYSLRESSELALSELVEVAESPLIDNTEVFDPDEVFRLLRALLSPRQEDLEPDEFVTIVEPEKYGDEFVAYADALYVQMDKVMKPYRDSRFPDPGSD